MHRCSIKMVRFPQVTELFLVIRFFSDSIRQPMTHVTTLFERTYILRSLKMLTHRPSSSRMKFIFGISKILPHHLEHLQMNITSVDEMTMLFKPLVHLFSVTFELSLFGTVSSTEIIDWFNIHMIDFFFRTDDSHVYVWLRKYKRRASQTCFCSF